MAQEKATMERVSADELEAGDVVLVHVNSRAARHLNGNSFFEAIVDDTSFGDIKFKPTTQIQENQATHTWYSDIGYIHGQHSGLGRYSDIGKVRYVEK